MKTLKILFAAFCASALFVSCSPSAEKLAKEYQKLATELAQAKIDGDEEKCEKLMEQMADLNEKIMKLAEKKTEKAMKKAEKETEEAMKKAEKGLEKAGKEIEKAFDL